MNTSLDHGIPKESKKKEKKSDLDRGGGGGGAKTTVSTKRKNIRDWPRPCARDATPEANLRNRDRGRRSSPPLAPGPEDEAPGTSGGPEESPHLSPPPKKSFLYRPSQQNDIPFFKYIKKKKVISVFFLSFSSKSLGGEGEGGEGESKRATLGALFLKRSGFLYK